MGQFYATQPGIWIHTSSTNGTLHILPCEAEGACHYVPGVNGAEERRSAAATGNNAVLRSCYVDRLLASGAVCGTGNAGFMCASCDKGYTKINGQCIDCPGFNYATLGVTLVMSLVSAFYLLHKSTGSAVVSPAEIRTIWKKMDKGGSGPDEGEGANWFLDVKDAQLVYFMTGVVMSDTQMAKVVDEEFDINERLSMEDFVRLRASSQPTSGFAIAIFFVQTMALVAKDASFFGAADALNLDSEQATGTCVSPLGYNERFIAKMVVTPLIMFAGVPLSRPVWNWVRRKGPQKLMEKMKLPQQIGGWSERLEAESRDALYLKRGLLNAFLYVFAPLTREAVQTLVCVPTCTDETHPECVPVLAFDMGVKCFVGDHLITAAVAMGELLIIAVFVPLWLIHKVQQARYKRNQSLKLKVSDVELWFDAYDEDGSGDLGRKEIKQLLTKLGETSLGRRKMDEFMRELDTDGDNEISKQEFTNWYKKRVEQVSDCALL